MEERLIELEVKFSHQELLIEELQLALFEQHKMFEKLEKGLKLLTECTGTEAPEIGGANEKPPHY